MRPWWSKIEQAFGRRRRLASELEQEMDAHLQFLIDENLERGMSPEQAQAAARREFGNRTAVQAAELSSVAIPQIRITAAGYSLCVAGNRKGACLLAPCDSYTRGRHRSQHGHLQLCECRTSAATPLSLSRSSCNSLVRPRLLEPRTVFLFRGIPSPPAINAIRPDRGHLGNEWRASRRRPRRANQGG